MASYTLSPIGGAGSQFFDNSGNVLSGGKLYTYQAGTTTPIPTYTNPAGTTANSNPVVFNSAGRPANEIWLSAEYVYKFVLKDANDVLIATYDNIPGLPQPPIVNDASSVSYEPNIIVTAGSFVVGQTYMIASLGNTDFVSIGAVYNSTGIIFTATGAGSGTGTAYVSTTVETRLRAYEASGGSNYIGFLQAGTGAVSRTVQSKLRDTVNVKDFGAVGDGITDDTAAIQAALDYCSTNEAQLWGDIGTYLITDTIEINCSADLSEMNIEADATLFSPAILVGPNVSGQYLFDADIKLPKITNTAKTGTGWSGFDTAIGVEVANVYQSRITVTSIYNFGIGLKVGGYGVGCVYNTFNIGVLFNNKINLQCKAGNASGWSNQNTFIGGRYAYSSSEGTAVSGVIQIQLRDFGATGPGAPNTNVWLNPSVEGNEPEFHFDIQGAYNTFISPRLETSGGVYAKINFHAVSTNETVSNHFIGGYKAGITYTFSGAGTSNNNGYIASRANDTLDYSGNGVNVRNSSSTTITAPHFQGFPPSIQPLPKDQTATDWVYRIYADGIAGKRTGDAYPRIIIDYQSGRFWVGNGTVYPTVGYTGSFTDGSNTVTVVGGIITSVV